MGFFSKILSKLGFPSAEASPAPAAPTEAAPLPPDAGAQVAATEAPAGSAPMASAPPPPVAAAPAPVTVVDVVAQLEGLAAASPQKLNWKRSIVDLLKLLELDNSLAARKELAKELGCPSNLMGGDYAKMNIWLHKEVLNRLAKNGGNIPSELLD